MAKFEERLKELRKKNNLTQDELAKKLHITKQALSHYENGSRYPKRETLEAIADLFNVDMDYLTGRSSVTTVVTHNDQQIHIIKSTVLTKKEEKLILLIRKHKPSSQNILIAKFMKIANEYKDNLELTMTYQPSDKVARTGVTPRVRTTRFVGNIEPKMNHPLTRKLKATTKTKPKKPDKV